MRKLMCTAVAGAVLSLCGPMASATVLTFDNIGTGGSVPVSYGGLDWSAGAWLYFGDIQPPYAPNSMPNRAFTMRGSSDESTAIHFPTPGTFQGAYFAGYDIAPVTFELRLGGVLVATSATLTPSGTPVFLPSGYDGLVDTVIVASPHHDFFVMDDFTFNQVSAVPEPDTLALMIAGLGAIGLLCRSRRRFQ